MSSRIGLEPAWLNKRIYKADYRLRKDGAYVQFQYINKSNLRLRSIDSILPFRANIRIVQCAVLKVHEGEFGRKILNT